MAETTHAGTEVPAGEHGGKGAFPPFESGTFPSQLVWLAIAFGLLYILMSKVALPRVAEILKTRGDSIASDLAAAQRMKAESDAAAAAHEQSLAQARGEAQAIAGRTHDAVAAETETTRKGLEAKLAERLAEAEAQIAATKAAALGNVRAIAIDAAGAIIERLTGRSPEAGAVEAAVDSAAAR
ncbi:F0F1 ATP synthase subunit B [Labrys wisconsinensis]|uniref:ATP synthase subunit b n=1 Tax=Labrys wisconsinensis TaxID=425677 RepID=A0ABU0J899_9HYPH|nr:F0F1 ATP synthase subunit B [Labrys wisconsinensis]MDQ0470497.1 F-type H+-transporting ATPase subunit b [Labrys wisconsinensis]